MLSLIELKCSELNVQRWDCALPPQESTLNVDLDFKQPFLELNRILEALHEQDLGPALE